MTLRDVIELTSQRFRTRPSRYILTIFGVSSGIGVVYVLISLGFGLQDLVIGKIATSESLLSLTVTPLEQATDVISLNDTSIKKFREIPHVVDVSPLLAIPAEIAANGLRAQTLVQAVHPKYFSYAGVTAGSGYLLSDDSPRGVVVSSPILKIFNISEQEAVGKELSLTLFVPPQDANDVSVQGEVNIIALPEPFVISGVITSETNAIYILPQAVPDAVPHRYDQARVRVDGTESIQIVRSDLITKGFSVQALTDTVAQLNQIFRFTQIALGTLGIIALFIAAVGMFNTMTISLLERTREVGILRALGATGKDVWLIFLFESVSMSIFAGILGILLGFVLSSSSNYVINIIAVRFGGEAVSLFSAPLWLHVAIMSIALFVGFATGFYPAHRAAKLNPIEALRHE